MGNLFKLIRVDEEDDSEVNKFDYMPIIRN